MKKARPGRLPKSPYADYVPHPRFGQAPRFTGLDAEPGAPNVHLHWNTRRLTASQKGAIRQILGRKFAFPDDGSRWVPGTAIVANLARQSPATIPVTHYYDIDRPCRNCRRRFIFFAAEQKHWYEVLGFPLEAQAVCCVPCRKQTQALQRARRRYETLIHLPAPTPDTLLDLIECALTLVEEAVFGRHTTERIRAFLNRLPDETRITSRFATAVARLQAVESGPP